MTKRLFILATLLLAGTFSSAFAALANDPYPLEYWALRNVIDNAQVSPDGKRLAIMKIPNKDGDPIVEVYDASNLSKEPFRFNADPMEITNIYWASNKDIVFTARQMVRDKIKSFDERDPAIENLLPNKPTKIIISFQEGEPDGPGAKLDAAFRPRAYWEFDLDKGTKKLLVRGKISLGAVEFDGEGHPWLARF